jgi:hypothetical protein
MTREQALTLWRTACESSLAGQSSDRMIETFAAEVRRECIVRVEAEHLGTDVNDDGDNEGDAAYNQALRDAALSLRAWF